jgi:hypothetical protein
MKTIKAQKTKVKLKLQTQQTKGTQPKANPNRSISV